MRLRAALLFAVSALILTLAAYAPSDTPSLLVLDWAAKGAKETPPVAVLVEFGRKDTQATKWTGTATFAGATAAHREGYRFQAGDKLTDPNGWEASSHRPGGAKKGNPAQAAIEGMSSVGVIVQLTNIKPDATMTLNVKGKPDVTVKLADVLAGKPTPLWNGAGVVRLISAAAPVTTGKTEDSFPAAAYGPDGTLWFAYIAYTLKEENRRVQPGQLSGQPKDFQSYFKPEFGDQLFVKSYKGGQWGPPIAVTDAKQDLVGCAVAVAGDGTVYTSYSAQRNGKNVLFARPIAPGGALQAEEVISDKAERNVHPVACTEKDGTVRVLCQTWQPTGQAVISSFRRVNKEWVAGAASANPGRAWHPTVSVGPKGEIAQAYDCYRNGDYDVCLTTEGGAGAKADNPVAASARFETRPSLAYDGQGRLWIAHEEGPENWGKDFGPMDPTGGNPLYNMGTVRVLCVQDGKLMQPTAKLPPLGKLDKDEEPNKISQVRDRFSHPQVGVDGKGRVWVTYLQRGGSRGATKLGTYWLTVARRLEGDRWSDPIELHHSDGMMDPKPVLLPNPAGGITVLHNSDGRFNRPNAIQNRVYMSQVNLAGDPAEPKLVPHELGSKDEKALAKAKAEAEAIERIRGYKVESAGKSYRLLRGEYHRHTEISSDGGNDGSIGDMWRYGIDAADMDWIGNTDHDNGGGREYTWWITQKLSDAYHVASRFTPMFSYERSVPYPHGHRNVIFAKRGVLTLPRLAPPAKGQAVAGIHADDAKMLYRYLHELDGICASHTSATTMGTDWRDNDPKVEPIVEIYQGDRNSYEKEAAPRAGYDAASGKQPVQIAGWHPDGFVNVAMGKKGYKFGFQSSSDHISTHISYFVVMAEKHDRDSLLAAMKKRHCYGATDNIILDVRSGDNVMGDEFKASGAPKLEIKVMGTSALKKIDILRDAEVVATIDANQRDYQGTWTDPKPLDGTHYYYVRVMQADNELAWGSPMWITAGK